MIRNHQHLTSVTQPLEIIFTSNTSKLNLLHFEKILKNKGNFSGMWKVSFTRTKDRFNNQVFMMKQTMDEELYPGILCESG